MKGIKAALCALALFAGFNAAAVKIKENGIISLIGAIDVEFLLVQFAVSDVRIDLHGASSRQYSYISYFSNCLLPVRYRCFSCSFFSSAKGGL